MSGSPKMTIEIALAGVLEVLGHMQVRVHAGLEHRDAAELGELRGVRLVVEGTGDQHIEPGIARLAGCGDEGPRAERCQTRGQ